MAIFTWIGRLIFGAIVAFLVYFVVFMTTHAGEKDARADSLIHITKSQYGEAWPFYYDSVEIGCTNRVPVVVANNVAFGLTGFSSGQVGRSVDELMIDDPNIPGAKKNISAFIDMALKQCESN